jgi:hypothetical protein
VLAMARQLGSALGVAIFVAVLGTRPATGPAVFHRAWIVVLITAAMTACAGLATGRRLIRQRPATSAARRSPWHWIPGWPQPGCSRLPGHQRRSVARGARQGEPRWTARKRAPRVTECASRPNGCPHLRSGGVKGIWV